jgi:hypothetical protein
LLVCHRQEIVVFSSNLKYENDQMDLAGGYDKSQEDI